MGSQLLTWGKLGIRKSHLYLRIKYPKSFYVPDTRNKKKHVVLPGKRRVVGVENVVDEEEYNQFDEVPPFGTCNLPVLLDSEKKPLLAEQPQG